MSNLTVRDVIRYHVCRCGDKIHEIKNKNTVIITGPAPGEKVVTKHISPLSPDWAEYQGFKRECSMWLTAVKIHKLHPDFSTSPIDRETKEDFESKVCHLSRVQRANATRYFMEATRRLMRIKDQLEHNGSKKVTTRASYVIDPKTKTAKLRTEHDTTYVDKSFDTIRGWKLAYEAAYSLRVNLAEVAVIKETEHAEAVRADKA